MAARYAAFVPDVTWLVCPLHATAAAAVVVGKYRHFALSLFDGAAEIR